jgi:hypothetical protein
LHLREILIGIARIEASVAHGLEDARRAVDPIDRLGRRYFLLREDLKRHLSTDFGLTPDAYRAKWNLPHDYPMTAPNYAAQRSQLAKSIGLGRKAEPVAPAKKAPARWKAKA